MNTEPTIHYFSQFFERQWEAFLHDLPRISLAIIVLIIGLLLIHLLKNTAQKIIDKRATDTLATDFLVHLISAVFLILLIAMVFSILGWNSFTSKILAAAGISTFVIGFALKDIGENFLSGIIMAFRRPFRVGDLVEVSNIKGRVVRLSLRDTLLKTLDGRDVFVPNGMILKNPLQNYTMDDFMRAEFIVGLDYDDDVAAAMTLIENIINTDESVVLKERTQVIITELAASTVNVTVRYWYKTDEIKAPGLKLKSLLMLKVFTSLQKEGFSLPSDIMTVNLQSAEEKTQTP